LVRTALAGCERPDVQDTAELLTSELVTNALLHAGTDLVVHVQADDLLVRVAVDDGSDRAPALGDFGTSALGGRGLPLVASLASRWGWEPLTFGKRVWFEV
jgi:anti-sigma regulatory factor (Ser/Thr protein kinase)